MTITIKEIENLLDKQKKSIITEIQSKIEDLSSELNRKLTNLGNRIAVIETVTTELQANSSSHDVLIKQLEEKTDQLYIRNQELETQLEDQINRSLRKTLIVRGIKEDDKEETWQKTEELLADLLQRHLQIAKEDGIKMIDRAHRGGRMSKNGRPIYVKFKAWKDSQQVLNGFTKQRIRNTNMNIKIDQMYSKKLTERRNLAMQERKILVETEQIVSGYINFPAKLMIKKAGTPKYILYKEF